MEYKSPVSIYFIWHYNDHNRVKPIVDYCKKNLSYDTEKPFSRSINIPVFMYTSKCFDLLPECFSVSSEKAIAFVFISDYIIASDEWELYLKNIQNSNKNLKVIPISISDNAYSFHLFKDINYIRLNDLFKSEKSKSYEFIEIAHEIYRWLFEEQNKKLKIFISHSKNDKYGLKLAKKIKKVIDEDYTFGNFFDSNDIQKGEVFSDKIIKDIKHSTLIIIHSDLYSSRYWCQKELICAKEFNRPIVSVDIVEGFEDRTFPIMCNFPNIGYEQQNNVDLILELALVETIRFNYYKLLMNAYKKSNYIPMNAVTFNRVPDFMDIKDIKDKWIIYPEPVLYDNELNIYKNAKMATPLSYKKVDLHEKRVGISISGVSEDELFKYGQDKNHLIYFSQILAKKLLNSNATLVYGGDLRENGFTRCLFDEAQILQDRNRSSKIHLENYIAWPIYLHDNKKIIEWKAKYKNVAKMIHVACPDDVKKKGIDS